MAPRAVNKLPDVSYDPGPDQPAQYGIRTLLVLSVLSALVFALLRWLGRWPGLQMALGVGFALSTLFLLLWLPGNWTALGRLKRRHARVLEERQLWQSWLRDQPRELTTPPDAAQAAVEPDGSVGN